jgi:hypothetical protein
MTNSYIRKKPKSCDKTNDFLGKQIWQWIKDKDNTAFIEEDVPCYWDTSGDKVNSEQLPQTTAQITFKRELLPHIYTFLDELAG